MAALLRDKSSRSGRKIQGTRVARETKRLATEEGRRPSPRKGTNTSARAIDAEHVGRVQNAWLPLLDGVSTEPPGGPLDVLLGEAVLVGLAYQAYWRPTPRSEGPNLPGFSSWAEGAFLHEHSGYELLELVTAIGWAHAEYERASEVPAGGSPMLRAQAVLRELKGTLEFLFDDGAHPREDERLKKLSKAYPRPRSHQQMAVALQGYYVLALAHRSELAKLSAFDLKLLDEALALSGALEVRRVEVASARENSGASQHLATRNQLLALLRERVGRIRRAAHRVFSEHPEIVRKFGSDYQRERRKQRRGRARDEAKGNPP
jgi:hypothetical protein